jgi:hypothetical protein
MPAKRDGAAKAKKILHEAIREALTEIGRDYVDTLRDLVNVRVVYIGGTVIRSDPGEPPRREWGDLWRSFGFKVASRATTLEALTIFSTSMVSFALEYGTDRIEPRPHWEPAAEQAGDLFEELKRRVKDKLRRKGSSQSWNPPRSSVRYG